MAEEIAWLAAVDLLARFRAGTLSPVDVTESLLGRIEQSDPSGRPCRGTRSITGCALMNAASDPRCGRRASGRRTWTSARPTA
jgi:hypothetical protein